MTLATNVRKALYEDVKRRFVDNERDGHLEDLLVSTILDPRFKLMNFEGVCYRLVLLQGSTYSCLISTLVSGCTHDMKMNAERWLKDNYNADWAPKSPQNGYNASTKKAAFQQRPKPAKPNVGLAAFSALVAGVESSEEEEGEEDEIFEEPEFALHTEVDAYLQLPALPFQRRGTDTNPLDWWSVNGPNMPHLCKMARQFLAMPASSAGPERVFSSAGKMHDDKKKRLSEDVLCMMLDVKMNV
jgi:hypothetical protein